MALFCDEPLVTIGELQQYESSVAEVATTESIDLETKLLLAKGETASDLAAYLARMSPGASGGGAESTPMIEQVVVTEPLQRWLVLRSLALVFRDAYHSQLNDRYKAKWQEYARQSASAFETLRMAGIGVVAVPVPKAERPVLSVAEGLLPSGTYYVTITWIGPGGQEGAPSEPAVIITPELSRLRVTCPTAKPNVLGWHVYVGLDIDQQSRQTQSPLGVNEEWVIAEDGLVEGSSAGSGQRPDKYVIDRQTLRRG